MAVHLPGPAGRQRQPARGAGGRAAELPAHFGHRHEQLFRAAARQPDLRDGRDGDRAAICWPTDPGTYPGLSAQFSGDGFSDMRFDIGRARPAGLRGLGQTDASRRGQAGRRELRQTGAAQQRRAAVDIRRRRARIVRSPGDGRPARTRRQPTRGRRSASRRARGTEMLGKLTWAAIPFDQPIPLVAGALVVVVIVGILALIIVKGLVAVSLERVDHQRRPQAHRRDVCRARAGDAAARLRRRDHDARRSRRSRPAARRLPAARALRPDFLGPRHDHDLLRGDDRS